MASWTRKPSWHQIYLGVYNCTKHVPDFYSFNLFSEKCFSTYCQIVFVNGLLMVFSHRSGGKWIPSPNCTNIAILKCELTFDELHWHYFVRVKTTFKGMSSNWTTTSKSFQPYGDSKFKCIKRGF